MRYQHVPQHIAEAAQEAIDCHAQGSRRAAVMLARSVIEASVEARGYTRGTMIQRITRMTDDGILSPITRHSAASIWLFGNASVHELMRPVSTENAHMVLLMMDLTLRECFDSANTPLDAASLTTEDPHDQSASA